VFEELAAGDRARAAAVYAAALRVVPHGSFTFAKLWLGAAHLEVRRRDVGAARRLLGASLGMCPKERVLRGYIDLEARLGEADRVRRLHEKFVTLWPFHCAGWCRFAALEAALGEPERARAIYELAVGQPVLDMPEAAWKAYIDFEIDAAGAGGAGDAAGGDPCAAARALYERLLARTQHVKAWMSYAAFEASVAGSATAARAVYRRAWGHFGGLGGDGKADRALVLETARAFEAGLCEDEEAAEAATREAAVAAAAAGPPEAAAAAEAAAKAAASAVAAARAALAAIDHLMPRRVVRRRPRLAADGSELEGEAEEYVDLLFPDDEAKPASLRLLEMAQRWKKAGGGSVDAVLQSAQHAAALAADGGATVFAAAVEGGLATAAAPEAEAEMREEAGSGAGASIGGGIGAAATDEGADELAPALLGVKRSAAEAFGPSGGLGEDHGGGAAEAHGGPHAKQRRVGPLDGEREGGGGAWVATAAFSGNAPAAADPNALDIDEKEDHAGRNPTDAPVAAGAATDPSAWATASAGSG